MVDALAVDGVGWPAKRKVPFEEIGFQGFCGVVWRRAVGYFGGLSNWRQKNMLVFESNVAEIMGSTYECAGWLATWC